MIDLVAHSLQQQCDAVVVCGREEPGFLCLPDHPKPDCGPAGGISAALQYARTLGFDAVLSAACDIPNLPTDLVDTLAGDDPAIIQSQPAVGFWPVSTADEVERFLDDGGRKLFDLGKAVGARLIRFDPPLLNINHPDDLPRPVDT